MEASVSSVGRMPLFSANNYHSPFIASGNHTPGTILPDTNLNQTETLFNSSNEDASGTLFRFLDNTRSSLSNNSHVTTSLSKKCLWDCQLCSASTLFENIPKGWKHRLVIIFHILQKYNSNSWQHLQNDVFPFIEAHWDFFSSEGFKKVSNRRHWKLTLQDALAHNKETFESGQASLHKKGYWRLISPNESEEDKQLLLKALQEDAMEESTEPKIPEGFDNYTNQPSLEVSLPTENGIRVDETLAKEFMFFLARKGIVEGSRGVQTTKDSQT